MGQDVARAKSPKVDRDRQRGRPSRDKPRRGHANFGGQAGNSLGPLRAMVAFIRPYLGRLVVAVGASLLASLSILSIPVALRYLIDSGLANGDPGLIDRYFMILMVVIVAFGGLASLQFYLIMWIGERVVADIREKVYRHVIRQDLSFFEVTQTGEILSRLISDAALVQSVCGAQISVALRGAVICTGALTMLLVTSPTLTFIVILLVPAAVMPVVWFARRVRKLSREAQERLAASSGLANETLNAIQTVQAFTTEELQSRRFREAVEATFRAGLRCTRLRAAMTGSSMVLLFAVVMVVLWFGTQSVIDGDITRGQLGQFVLLTLLLAGSGRSLSQVWGEVGRAGGAMDRLVELLDAEPKIKVPPNPVPMHEPGRGSIAFDRVAFSYPSRPGDRALTDFTLEVASGETIAFVGPSGAGKSTTFQLLLRFFDPEAGSIRIDGVDITQADPVEVRRRIGVVPQEVVIFATTARENIRYGRPGATDAEVEAAAKVAEVDEFLRRLPDGYDTFLGERGMRLSGGQRQRVAIARAILRDPLILLLDEATSSLDAENERLVQNGMEYLMRNRTTIIVAHRLATVLKAQRIVVMNEGRIVDTGTHSELALRDPLYARLARLQFGERAEELQIERRRAASN